jgi:hypothetical protein
MRLVKVFYESLPYLCFVAGVATLGYFRDFPGSFLGLVLVFIAGVVFLARSNQRERLAKKNS